MIYKIVETRGFEHYMFSTHLVYFSSISRKLSLNGFKSSNSIPYCLIPSTHFVRCGRSRAGTVDRQAGLGGLATPYLINSTRLVLIKSDNSDTTRTKKVTVPCNYPALSLCHLNSLGRFFLLVLRFG